jgi:hypothetical protein
MALSYTTALRSNQLDEITALVDAGSGAGKVRIYSGTPPANVGTALSGNTLLAELILTDPSAGAASGGVLTFSAIADDTSADASGDASFFRILDSDNNPVVQGTVGTSGADLNFAGGVEFVAGGLVEITSFTITAGNV